MTDKICTSRNAFREPEKNFREDKSASAVSSRFLFPGNFREAIKFIFVVKQQVMCLPGKITGKFPGTGTRGATGVCAPHTPARQQRYILHPLPHIFQTPASKSAKSWNMKIWNFVIGNGQSEAPWRHS